MKGNRVTFHLCRSNAVATTPTSSILSRGWKGFVRRLKELTERLQTELVSLSGQERLKTQTELDKAKKDAKDEKEKMMRDAIDDLNRVKGAVYSPVLSNIFAGILNILRNADKSSNLPLLEHLFSLPEDEPEGAVGGGPLPPGAIIRVKATSTYIAENLEELSLEQGDIILIMESNKLTKADEAQGWLYGRNAATGDEGIFPSNFTTGVGY